MYIDLVQSTLLDLAARAVANTEFRPGQTFQGIVESTPNGLMLAAGRARIALPDTAALKPGDTVSVEVQQGTQGLQLRVTPMNAGATAASETTPAPLAQLAATILESVSNLRGQDPLLQDLATRLTPAALAGGNTQSTGTALRALFSLFATRQASGEDLGQIATLLASAERSGVTLPPEAAVVRDFLAASPQDFQRLLQNMAEAATRPAEGRLAQLLSASQSGAALPQDLQTSLQHGLGSALARLADDPGLTTFLRNQGQLDAFNQAVAHVQDRLLGSNMQNLRGLEQPYVFMELPFVPGGPISEGQLHVLADGKSSRSNTIDARQASIVIDLSTTHLGDLWIHMQTISGTCRCNFRTTSPEAAKAIQEAAPELAGALTQAGYENAQVHVGAWDGNRLREAADLMRRFAGLSVTA